MSSNEILDSSIPDTTKGTIEGFDSVHAIESRPKIFLNLSGFLGIYPAFSQVLHVLKHMDITPCTYCKFCFKRGTEGPKYSYTTEIQSANQSGT